MGLQAFRYRSRDVTARIGDMIKAECCTFAKEKKLSAREGNDSKKINQQAKLDTPAGIPAEASIRAGVNF
jgi:hypothetical protein